MMTAARAREQAWALEAAAWIEAARARAKETGQEIDTRPFVQNVGLIVDALRMYARMMEFG